MLKLVCHPARRLATRAMATSPTQVDPKDVFGTLSESGSKTLEIQRAQQDLPNDPDGYDVETHDLKPRKSHFYYKYEINKYARMGKAGIHKALELFQQMKSEDRFPTENAALFSPLIYGCAKAGYTKRAFELYQEHRKHYKKPTPAIITGLIAACGRCPFPEYGLERLDWIITHAKTIHKMQLNDIQYNAAIMSYGRLGNLEKAAEMFQEMIESGNPLQTESLNMLLIGCASNKEAGSTIALKILKIIKMYGLRPTVDTYALVLRCIRDCGMGPPELIRQAVEELPKLRSFKQKLIDKKKQLVKNKKSHKQDMTDVFEWLPVVKDLGQLVTNAVKVNSQESTSLVVQQESNREKKDSQLVVINESPKDLELLPDSTKLPNLLSEDHIQLVSSIEAIDLNSLHRPKVRFLLFGGLHGFLDAMKYDGCKIDTKTYTFLLDLLPCGVLIERDYLSLAEELKVRKDLVFYDRFIAYVCSNYRDSGRLARALNYLDEMYADNIRPSVSTFAALAAGCDSIVEARQLVSDMKKCNLATCDEISENLFRTARMRYDINYLDELIDLAKQLNFKPTSNFVEFMEGTRLRAREVLLKRERGEKVECDFLVKDFTSDDYDAFSQKLGRWLKKVELRQDEHPWAQYHVDNSYRKAGLSDYVQEFKALEQIKSEALKEGRQLGNVYAKAERLRQKKTSAGTNT